MNLTQNQSPAAQAAPPVSSHYRWAIVGMLWLICFFNYADRVAISSVLPKLQELYHFTKSEQGLIVGAFTWVYAIASPFAGQIGDRASRKWVILGGLTIWSLITGLTAKCVQVWQFVTVRGSEGLGEALYFPASMALISDYHAPATRSRAIGLHQTGIYAGTIFGGSLAGWMTDRYGWRSPFWALAVAGVVLAFVLHRFIREPRKNEAEIRDREDSAAPKSIPIREFLIGFFRTPTAVLLVSAYFGANLVGYVFLSWMPTFLKEKYGLSLAAAGLGATFFIQVGSMMGAGLGGVAADAWARRRIEGRIRVQTLAILCGTPFVFLCGWTRNPTTLIVAMTLFGICKGMYDANLTSAFYDVIAPDRRGTATGLMNMIGWAAAGLGAVAVGFAVDPTRARHVTMSVAISSTAVLYLGTAVLLHCAAFFAPRDILRNRHEGAP